MRTSSNPETIHPPVAPYTHQIETTGPQRWLTLSGQVGMEADGPSQGARWSSSN